MKEIELLNEFEKRFGVTVQEETLEKEDLKFLDKRAELEELCSWDFNAFVKYYQLIEKYGLKEKLLGNLAWMISDLYDDEQLGKLINTEFYKRFGKHKIIDKAFTEVNLMKER